MPHGNATTLEFKFWSKAKKAKGNACWLWQGAPGPNGYGQLEHGYRYLKAHRVSWEIHYGPIPKAKGWHGVCVLHDCDNRMCVNPAHLFLGTHKENMEDKVAKGRQHRLQGVKHPAVKLTEAEVKEIQAAPWVHGMGARLAKRYGVSQSQISKVRKYQSWKHL